VATSVGDLVRLAHGIISPGADELRHRDERLSANGSGRLQAPMRERGEAEHAVGHEAEGDHHGHHDLTPRLHCQAPQRTIADVTRHAAYRSIDAASSHSSTAPPGDPAIVLIAPFGLASWPDVVDDHPNEAMNTAATRAPAMR
jgi:hypothetical protein